MQSEQRMLMTGLCMIDDEKYTRAFCCFRHPCMGTIGINYNKASLEHIEQNESQQQNRQQAGQLAGLNGGGKKFSANVIEI